MKKKRLLVALICLVSVLTTAGLAGCVGKGSLEGKVIDADGRPVPGVTVRAENGKQTVSVELETDENGNYSFRNIPAGEWEVEFDDGGTVHVGTEKVTVKNGEVTRLDFTIGVKSVPVNSNQSSGSRLIGEHFYYSQDCIWGDTLVGLEYEYVEGKRAGQYLTAFDLKTIEKKRVLQIPEDRMAGTPSIYQNRIVWDSIDREEFFKYAALSSLPPPPNYDIFLLDLDTGEVNQLTTEEHSQRSPRIYGDTVIWLDARNSGEQFPYRYDIYAYDLKTGQETRITKDTTVEGYNQAAIGGGIIVWTDMRHTDMEMASHAGNDAAHNNEIYAYDLETGEERRLTTSPRNDQAPDISGNIVTWLRQEDSRKADIFAMDLENGVETQVSRSGYAAFSPSIDDKKITWTDARSSKGNTNADVIENGQGPGADIYLYDLKTQTETRLTETGEEKVWASPVISGDYVIYQWSRQIGPLVYIVEANPSNEPSSTVSSLPGSTVPEIESPVTSSGNWRTLSGDINSLDLLVESNTVWAATSAGVVCWNLGSGDRTQYTEKDGLGSNNVREIIRDSQGNIWVTCHVNGVSRFDGEKWESFNVTNGLCSNDTITLAADEEGGVWVSAYWGVSYYDGRQWYSYSNHDPNETPIGGENPMKDCTNLTMVDAELGAADVIFVDSRGNVWFSSRGRGITRFDGKEWQTFTGADGLDKGGIYVIFEDQDGNIWFDSYTGLTGFDGTRFTGYSVPTFQSIIPRPVGRDILQDNQGNLWLAAYGGGVSRYDGSRWQTFWTQDGLPDDNARDLFLTPDCCPGVITDKGVCRFDGSAWQPMTTADGLPEGQVRLAVNDDEGRLWLAGEGGVSYFSK